MACNNHSMNNICGCRCVLNTLSNHPSSNQDNTFYDYGTIFVSSITLVFDTSDGYHMPSMATYYSVIRSTLIYAYGYTMHYIIDVGLFDKRTALAKV